VIGIASIGTLDQADVLISDQSLAPEARSLLADVVGELVLVGVGDPSGVHAAAAPAPPPAAASGRAH
jgi:hypothetical protein